MRQLSPNTGSMADQINNWVANRTRGRITNVNAYSPQPRSKVSPNGHHGFGSH